MPIVLIDIYTMPDEAAATFVERARPIQAILKTLPGFIEGYLHECMAGDSPFRFVSTAVWADEAALDNARNAVNAENRRLGLRSAGPATRARYRAPTGPLSADRLLSHRQPVLRKPAAMPLMVRVTTSRNASCALASDPVASRNRRNISTWMKLSGST